VGLQRCQYYSIERFVYEKKSRIKTRINAHLSQSGTPWFQSLVPGSQPIINTGPDGLQRLDYVVSAASKRGIKLIIPFVNNWGDYGGMPAYMKYYNLNGGKGNSAWYLSSAAQSQYQAYIKAVVSRYHNSTAIFGWELANEPRCNGCSTAIVTDWAKKTASFIKSLDRNHLVAMGDEGFGLPDEKSYPYSFGEGVDFVKNLAIPDLDFGTLHLYPESCSYRHSCIVQLTSNVVSRVGEHYIRFIMGKKSRQSLRCSRETLSLRRVRHQGHREMQQDPALAEDFSCGKRYGWGYVLASWGYLKLWKNT